MLYKILSRLFRNDDLYNRYTPRPGHLLYALLLIAVGTVTIGHGWIFFGIMASLFGVMLGFTILLGMNWDKVIEYWEKIDNVARTMMSIKDTAIRHEIWTSMGYKHVPTNSSVIVKEVREDEKGVFTGWTKRMMPASPQVMQQIADKVLMSGKTSFIEEEFSAFVPNIRKVKKEFKKAGYIAPNNVRNVRLGYSFTKKGIDVLYESASDGVKIELKRR